MKFHPTDFKGLYIVDFDRFEDQRGVMIKPWINSDLNKIFGSNMETYLSSSHKGAMRGLHYQKGSSAQKKFVTCISGRIEDVAVDMRRESSTYGCIFNFTLNALDGRGVIIPKGFAHGVYAYKDSLFANISDHVYIPENEGGILWSSIPLLRDFPVTIVSEKDSKLPSLEEVIL